MICLLFLSAAQLPALSLALEQRSLVSGENDIPFASDYSNELGMEDSLLAPYLADAGSLESKNEVCFLGETGKQYLLTLGDRGLETDRTSGLGESLPDPSDSSPPRAESRSGASKCKNTHKIYNLNTGFYPFCDGLERDCQRW